MATRVLIVEDDPDMRGVLRVAMRVSRALEVVGEASDINSAIALADLEKPDVITLDLYLSDERPPRTFARVRAAAPDSRIVVFTGHESEREWVRANGVAFLGKGAGVGYLVDVLSG
jgi:DNA-binding NarL/FixJ family response regulator